MIDANERILNSRIYKGNPRDIIIEMSKELTHLLHGNSIPVSGLHVIALLHIAASTARAEQGSDGTSGKMPSYKTLLSVLTHGLTGSSWTEEELRAFDEEFCQIVESLGGQRINVAESDNDKPIMMSPSLGIH